jgi:hypothetical protein
MVKRAQHPSAPGRRLCVGAVLLCLGMAATGCQFKGQSPTPSARSEPTGQASEAEGEIWRPRVESVRIYPATQFVTGGQKAAATLKASIELLDAMGDAIKAPGRLRCELFAVSERGRVGSRLYHWDVTVQSLDQQKQYFDLVTRTYVLRLALDSQTVTERPTLLRVTFMRADGQRLQDERTLPIEW